MTTKLFALTAVIATALLVGVLLTVVPLYQQRGEAIPASETTAIASSTDNTITPTRDWRSYDNDALGFALRYPPELAVSEYGEAGGAISITFRNSATGKGFQVYGTPYQHSAITKEQLALDLPSGVMDNPGDIFVDDVRARSFFSVNESMGGTYEVWIINDGFLYEVVTHDLSALWLDSILETWQFL